MSPWSLPPANKTMGITALVLGAWISVYCGISLLRTGLPETRPDNAPSDPRRITTVIGACFLILGVSIFVFAFLHHHHRIH